MPVIYKGKCLRLLDGKNGYEIRFMDLEGKEVRKRVPKSEEPMEYAILLDGRLERTGTLTDKVQAKFKDLVGLYVKELSGKRDNYVNNAEYGDKISPGTFKKTLVHINKHILPFFGDFDVEHIRPSTTLRFQANLVKGVKPQTANAVLGTMRRLMSFLTVHEYIETNPCREISNLQSAPLETKYTPTTAEVQQVIASADQLWKKVLIMLAADTGMRISEILALKWVDIRNDLIFVKAAAINRELSGTKTVGSKRKIKIDSKLTARLAELRLASSKDFVFTNEKGRLYTASDVLKQVLTPACTRANVMPFGWHGLRRHFINYQLDRGVPKNRVQKLVGHSIGSHVTDRHYREVRDEDVLVDEYVVSFG